MSPVLEMVMMMKVVQRLMHAATSVSFHTPNNGNINEKYEAAESREQSGREERKRRRGRRPKRSFEKVRKQNNVQ